MNEHFDLIIVGGGPAGLTAAIYARRAGKRVLLLEKESFGGQIASSPLVENFPGIPAVSGAELADRLFTQAEDLGARIELEEVLEIHDGINQKTVVTDYGTYTCTTLILATGMKHRTLGLPGENSLSGVSFCAVCDGPFHAGQDVAVVGGGNTALQDALFLSGLCRSVTIIHRRGMFRGDPILAERLRSLPNVRLVLRTVVEELHGTDGTLTGLTLRNLEDDRLSQLAVTGLFEAVGHLPEKKLAEGLFLVDQDGFAPFNETCVTPRPGVFVAGDFRAKDVRQLTTACADGAVAALTACKYCG